MNLDCNRCRAEIKLGNLTICQFFNGGRCYDQAQKECKRPDGVKKHLCSHIKTSSGKPCGGTHMKGEHDNTKHGN